MKIRSQIRTAHVISVSERTRDESSRNGRLKAGSNDGILQTQYWTRAFHKGEKYFEQAKDYQLLKDAVQWSRIRTHWHGSRICRQRQIHDAQLVL
jgi:hypothetical protein